MKLLNMGRIWEEGEESVTRNRVGEVPRSHIMNNLVRNNQHFELFPE